jgi:hypothetical protein
VVRHGWQLHVSSSIARSGWTAERHYCVSISAPDLSLQYWLCGACNHAVYCILEIDCCLLLLCPAVVRHGWKSHVSSCIKGSGGTARRHSW